MVKSGTPKADKIVEVLAHIAAYVSVVVGLLLESELFILLGIFAMVSAIYYRICND